MKYVATAKRIGPCCFSVVFMREVDIFDHVVAFKLSGLQMYCSSWLLDPNSLKIYRFMNIRNIQEN